MGSLDAFRELKGLLDGNVYLDEPMSRHTSYHLGGPAALYIECASVRDLGVTFDVLRAEQLPWTVIGKGSNLLVHDNGWKGAVLTLTGQFKELKLPVRFSAKHEPALFSAEHDPAFTHHDPAPAHHETGGIVAGAGVILATLVQAAFKHGYAGFEFAVGIPGTLGGALFMNAGTATQGIGSVVSKLTVYRPGVGLARIHAHELPWHYRSSGLPAGDIVVEAELKATAGHTGQIQARMEGSLNKRKSSQPLSAYSAGSVFRNPPNAAAGKLIEDLGLKGLRVGGAEISPVHANFIVNNGSATAADVLAIIVEVRRRVKEAYGTELQTEIRFVGFE